MAYGRGLSIKAILFGALTDIGGSVVGAVAMGVVLGVVLGVGGVPATDIAELLRGPAVLIPGIVMGLCFTTTGGFVAGRVAKEREVLHGGLVGAIGILFSLLFVASLPLWYTIASIACVVPCGMLGGSLAREDRNSDQERSTQTSMPSAGKFGSS